MKLILLFIFSLLVFTQTENKIIRKGNSDYKAEKFNSAASKYQKSLEINPENKKAKFNLGNSFYKLDSNSAASSYYQSIINDDMSDEIKSDAFYNYGNTLLKEKKFDESIFAYKEALKRNPQDMDAKYNLEYAKRMLMQQQQNQDKNQDQDQKQDQNQDKNQDQDQKQDQKQNQNEQKNQQGKNEQDQNKEQKDGKQAKPKQQKISKEQAEQMLKNLSRREKKILMGQKREKGEKKKVEKNW